MHRPNVAEFFRDDISLDQMRFMMWGTPQTPFSQWDFLAEGGFGKVFKVKDVSPPIESNGRQFSVVAVKIPKPEGVDELKAEVEALSKLAHENVVAILGMTEGASPGDDSKNWMMCLEYCESDLRKLVRRGECTAQLVKRLFSQIVNGMAYVHAQSNREKSQGRTAACS